MTHEDKDLLLKDLCARLPYGIIVQQSAQYPQNHFMYSVADKLKTESHDFKIIGIEGTNTLITDKYKEEKSYAKGIISSPVTICIYDNFTKQIAKPFLRPMSSMTEEEKENYFNLRTKAWDVHINDYWYYDNFESYDYLNSIHVDYRGLIEKGLAIAAPEGMY
jgi:hypothetical protein